MSCKFGCQDANAAPSNSYTQVEYVELHDRKFYVVCQSTREVDYCFGPKFLNASKSPLEVTLSKAADKTRC
jgi:hypothetical protein